MRGSVHLDVVSVLAALDGSVHSVTLMLLLLLLLLVGRGSLLKICALQSSV